MIPALIGVCFPVAAIAAEKPNIILAMADDQGWGQVGYYHHPHLKTPHLDAMAANGLRLDRFYAAAPVCTPTPCLRPDRTDPQPHRVNGVGGTLRLEEKTLAQALKAAGYKTAHFGNGTSMVSAAMACPSSPATRTTRGTTALITGSPRPTSTTWIR
ncbi:MAG: sulfatase-like hydrolase/transferase [Bdellovibrionaceae bacterium]|nr:sulfatase-like hydrolase/transferase [Pseudobdellovibrionaceae bacterium]